MREPQTRSVTVSEPHTGISSVSEPHTGNSSVSEPHTHNGQQICAGQYVLAKGMFPFTQSSGPCCTVFSDPSLRPAKVHYFAIHSFHANDSFIVLQL